MAEEAAAVMICCMPTTATFFKLARVPVRSWLSSSRRALRLTGLYCSNMTHSGSQSDLKDSLESGWNATDSNPQGRTHNAVRVDMEFDTYSLRQMDQKQKLQEPKVQPDNVFG